MPQSILNAHATPGPNEAARSMAAKGVVDTATGSLASAVATTTLSFRFFLHAQEYLAPYPLRLSTTAPATATRLATVT
ncbi:hypothetical protein DEO72_LG5g997 [Vigna unguiculata]|uniref:Uncharacterized protein n=1 Tax=Vigna unguiculata TaxID=3917 RepID=A0A4D6LX47_VIGUN|nr:hypothetical protein DEO72_LG5g997 [Vigna unguiculata]